MKDQRLSEVVRNWNKPNCGMCPYRNSNKCEKLHRDVSWFVANYKTPTECPRRA